MTSLREKAKKSKIVVKTPTQERSRQTVATILEACSRLLISEGFYAITTDKIAKEAGVSIGSLYQFFGNKESVVQAVVRNVVENDKRIFSEKMRPISPLPPEIRIRKMIELSVETLRYNYILRSKLSTIQYYVAESSYISESLKFFQEVVRYNLPVLPGRDMDKVAYLMVHAFVGLTGTIAVDAPENINDDSIIEELIKMFYSYLNLPLENSGPTIEHPKRDFI